MTEKKQKPHYSPEVRERAVRMVLDQTKDHPSQWAAIESIVAKIGRAPQTLHGWVAQAGIEPSVGSVGDSYDNALAETINGLYKAEVIWRRGPWRSFEAVECATLEWVDWFNNRRLLQPIGDIPPAEAEANYYAALEQPAMAA